VVNGGNILKSNAILYKLDKKATVTLTRALMLGFCTEVAIFLPNSAKADGVCPRVAITRAYLKYHPYVHLNVLVAL